MDSIDVEFTIVLLLMIFFPPMWLLIIADYFKCRKDDKKFLESQNI